jgi:hypothetical protein
VAAPIYRLKLAGTIFAVVAVAVALTRLLDDPGERYAEAAFARSLVTFAIARTLDGAISVAQGTEVAVEPGGVGVNFALGQILDPINDLVERFSVAMLVATSSLGLQNILLRMSTWWGTNLALALTAAFCLFAVWKPEWLGGIRASAAIRVLSVVVFVRFAVPVFVIASNLVFDIFLASEQQLANEALTTTSAEIEELAEEGAPPPSAEDPTLSERLESLVDGSLRALDVTGRMERLSQRVSDAVEHIINLIVIFALQSIILPLVFLWLFAESLKKATARAARL